MNIERLLQRRLFRVLSIISVWTLFGLFLTSQMYMDYSRRDLPVKRLGILALEMGYAMLWAALTPLILYLARRFPIARERWQSSLALHMLAGLFIGFFTRALHDTAFFFFILDTDRAFSFVRLLQNIYLIFDYGTLIYWVILLINYAFDYYRRYREGEMIASRLEAQLAQAQLQALKMQLHPHFLFNTLHSISALMHKNVEAADKMIARLGDFLRLTLENSGTQIVALNEELEFLKCYLEIERIRFQDRLSVRMEIEPETLDAELPNLILQPIVENAIRHAVAQRSDTGQIEIEARRQNGLLQLHVKDNGPGMTEQGLLKKGLGLANTQARLEQLYGSSYRFDLTNAPEGGLVVTLEIPFR